MVTAGVASLTYQTLTVTEEVLVNECMSEQTDKESVD